MKFKIAVTIAMLLLWVAILAGYVVHQERIIRDQRVLIEGGCHVQGSAGPEEDWRNEAEQEAR